MTKDLLWVVKNKNIPSWDCLLWMGVKFGHTAQKEKIMAKGNRKPRNVEKMCLSMKGEVNFCPC
jgi:hypothetical protein